MTTSRRMNHSTRRPRIGVICAIDLSMNALLLPQIRGMQQAGCDVVGICSDGPLVEALRAGGLRVVTVPISRRIDPWQDIRTVRALVRVFCRERFDIVHTHTPKAAFLGQLAAVWAGVPFRINTIHGLYFYGQTGRVSRAIYEAMERLTCRLATLNFSQSQEDVDYLVGHRMLPASRMQWIGNGIDLCRFNPTAMPADTRRQVRAELNIPDDAFVVGIVARMVREKGIAELFEAFASLRKSVPQAYLVHIGFVDRSRDDEVTPEQAEEHGIGPHCRFLGQRDDIARLMMAMDVYCLPSHREGYPRSVMEANAMGLPAVVTDIRGSREAVLDEVNGLLVPVRQPKALADALLRLYHDTDLRRRLGAGAIGRAAAEFDEQRVIQTILHAYRRLLHEYSSVACSPAGQASG